MHLKKTEEENVRELNEVTLQAGSSLKEMKCKEIEAAFPFYGFSNKNKNQWKTDKSWQHFLMCLS